MSRFAWIEELISSHTNFDAEPVHTTADEFGHATFFRRSTVQINPSLGKRSISKTLFKPGVFENFNFVWMEMILITELLGKDDLTEIIMWLL